MNAKDRQRRTRSLLRSHGPLCQICGRVFRPAELTLDHIVPRSQNGADALYNLRLACYPCNYGRHH